MRKVFKFLVAIIVIAIVFLIGCLVWNNYLQPVEVPDLLSDSVEFGSVVNKEEGETLEAFLDNKVFADQESSTLDPKPEGVAGFNAFMERYMKGLSIEKAAVESKIW